MLLLLSAALACEAWAPLTSLAPLSALGLDESSGLAPSRITSDQLWTHDDDGAAELFRFGIDGLSTVHAVLGADNEDWEDLASAPCGGADCLYIADIGAERDDPGSVVVYVGREPDDDGPVRVRERWELAWPGEPADAETLLVEPCSLEAWLVTRSELRTEVFAVPAERGPRVRELVPVATLAIGPVTGGDFAPDGSGVVLRTLDEAWLWRKEPGAPVDWAQTPLLVADGLEEGEAVTWEPDGDLLFTSEGNPTAVGRMACEVPSELPVCASSGCGCASGPWDGALRSVWALFARR